MIKNTEDMKNKIAWAALIFGVGYFITGITLFTGNAILVQTIAAMNKAGVENYDMDLFSVTLAWWMIALTYFSFTVLDTLIVLVFCGLVYLYGSDDWRLWAAAIIQIVWMAIAISVDTGAAGTTWVNAIQFGDGLNAEQLAYIYGVVQERYIDIFRWQARGYYLFAGIAYLILAKVSFEKGWPKSFSYITLLLAVSLFIEVLTFAITVIAGSSPIHIPAYALFFLVATPLWGIAVWWQLRKGNLKQ